MVNAMGRCPQSAHGSRLAAPRCSTGASEANSFASIPSQGRRLPAVSRWLSTILSRVNNRLPRSPNSRFALPEYVIQPPDEPVSIRPTCVGERIKNGKDVIQPLSALDGLSVVREHGLNEFDYLADS